MKTNLIKIIVGSSIVLTMAAVLALSVQAGDQIKGAQRLLQPSQIAVIADDAQAREAKTDCALCKNEAVENVNIEKGHIKTVTYSEKHLCAKCSTTIGVAGVGKAKQDLVKHTCSIPASGCTM